MRYRYGSGVKYGKLAIASTLAVTAMSVAAPVVSAIPTGSAGFGSGREVVIIDNKAEISNLDSCWASGFPRDITIDNRSSRPYLLFDNNNCGGRPIAVVPPHSIERHYGWSGVAGR